MSLQRKRYFWLRAYAFVYLPKAFPRPAGGNPAMLSLFRPLHICMSISSLSQPSGPNKYFPMAALFFRTTPKSDLPASFSLAVSSVVETPVSFLGIPKSLLSTYRNFTFPTCWDGYLWGNAWISPLAKSLEATSSFIWHHLILLIAPFHFIQKRLDCSLDGRMKNTCFSLSLYKFKISES